MTVQQYKGVENQKHNVGDQYRSVPGVSFILRDGFPIPGNDTVVSSSN